MQSEIKGQIKLSERSSKENKAMQAQDTEAADSDFRIVAVEVPENVRNGLKRNKIQYIHGIPDIDGESTQNSIVETIPPLEGKKPISATRSKKGTKMNEDSISMKIAAIMKNFFCTRIFACFLDDDDDCDQAIPLEVPVLSIEVPQTNRKPSMSEKNASISRKNTNSTLTSSSQEAVSKKDSVGGRIEDESLRIDVSSQQIEPEAKNIDEIIEKIEFERMDLPRIIVREALNEIYEVVQKQLSNGLEMDYDHIKTEANQCAEDEKKDAALSAEDIGSGYEIRDTIAELSFSEGSDAEYDVVAPSGEKEEWELNVLEENKPQEQEADQPAQN